MAGESDMLLRIEYPVRALPAPMTAQEAQRWCDIAIVLALCAGGRA